MHLLLDCGISLSQTYLSIVSYKFQNFQLLLWDKAETELTRLALRFSQLFYDNLLRVSAKLLVSYLKDFYITIIFATIYYDNLIFLFLSFSSLVNPWRGSKNGWRLYLQHASLVLLFQVLIAEAWSKPQNEWDSRSIFRLMFF